MVTCVPCFEGMKWEEFYVSVNWSWWHLVSFCSECVKQLYPMWSQSRGGGVQIIDHFLEGAGVSSMTGATKCLVKIPHINLTSDNSLMAKTSCSIRWSFQSGIRIHNWFKRGITLKLIFSSHSASLMARPVKRDLGHVKTWKNGTSRMTLCSCSVSNLKISLSVVH